MGKYSGTAKSAARFKNILYKKSGHTATIVSQPIRSVESTNAARAMRPKRTRSRASSLRTAAAVPTGTVLLFTTTQ